MSVVKAVVVALIATFHVSHACSQDYPSPTHQPTSPVAGARYEIVQSELAVKATFRLDRFTGRIWELVKTADSDNAWQETEVHAHPLADKGSSRPHFQIFTSGIALRNTFLIDTDSGQTWTLVTGKSKSADGSEYEYRAWQPFQYQR